MDFLTLILLMLKSMNIMRLESFYFLLIYALCDCMWLKVVQYSRATT